jgi:hypothetical protein
MDGLYLRTTIRFANVSGAAAKNYQAVSCQAQDRGHLGIPRTVNKDVETPGVSIKFITPEFLLSSQPIVELEAVLTPTLLKNLASGLTIVDRMIS